MGKEFLASKITSGKGNASPKATWWFRHGDSVVRYLVYTGIPGVMEVDKVRQEVLDIADEWDRWLPSSFPKGAMRRHATLEIGLVDAVRRKDTKAVDTIGELLVEDVGIQVNQLANLDSQFPRETLKRLLEEHIALFLERIRHDVEGTDKADCEKKTAANAMALVDLTLEWF